MQCTSWACVKHAEQVAKTQTAKGEGAKKDEGSAKRGKGKGDGEATWDFVDVCANGRGT